MKETFDEGQVERAYAALSDCLECVEGHFRLCIALLGNRPRSDRPKLSREDLRRMAEGLTRLRVAYDAARSLLKPMEKDLPALTTEPIRSGSLKASSWAEATLFHSERYVRDLADWTRFGKLPWDRKWQLYDVVAGNLPDVPEFRQRLKIEEARLRERAVPAGARYRALVLQLTGQSAALMELLVESEGKKVTHEDIASCLWPGEAVDGARIHKAVSRLRRELGALGYPEVASAITAQRGWYLFRDRMSGEGRGPATVDRSPP